ncbi:MAG: ABC transporter substrate-binding protein [Verrucomicrobia bacterium]|nr:ABC transporter substrate-binding protein [Verrucomicrobiota bacterium]
MDLSVGYWIFPINREFNFMQRFWILITIVVGLMAVACRPPPAVPDGGPLRIVSLAPSLTESLCAIGAGDLLVGRTSACNYPPSVVDQVPIIGGFGHPSLELLVNAHPTLVLDIDLSDESVAAQIAALGIPRHRIACDALDDIAPMLRELGQLTGHTQQANALATKIDSAIQEARTGASDLRLPSIARRAKEGPPTADLRPPPPPPHPSVYAEVWHDPLTTIGSHTFLADLIELAGGRIIAASVKKPYFQISPEQVVAENPDVILCLYMGPSSGAAKRVARRPGWQHITAVQHDCVFGGLDNDILLRPGPRLLEGLEAMRACIGKAYAERQP